MTTQLLRSIILFLLPALILIYPEKVLANADSNWQNQLTGISIGTDASNTDLQISISDPSGASDTTYLVKTAKGLAWIAKVTNEEKKKGDEGATDNYPSAPGFEGCTVKLDDNADIDLSEYYWTPIGSSTAAASPKFYGTFDGNHKMIKGLKINVTKTISGGATAEAYYAGLFGRLSTGSQVTNLGIQLAAEGVEGNSQNGDSYVGGLAGYNGGEIRNCFVIPTTGETNSSIKSTGNHDRSKYVGGIVGYNNGTITNCYTTVDVSVKYGKPKAGGIVGYNNGNISNVYATGKVETTDASADDCAGGIIGNFYGGNLSNALALNNVISGGIVSGSDGFHGAGRIAGIVQGGNVATSCYAPTKIRINGKVKGESEDKTFYGKRHHDDGLSADIDIDLSSLFPTTGSSDVWETNGDGNLPKLKGFDSAPQPDLALADYLDAPLNLTDTNGSLTLTFSNTDGWKYKKGSEGETSFSGRIKGTGTADLTVTNSTDEEPTLTFADNTTIGSTDDALTISSGKVILASEGTSYIYGKVALHIANGATCTFDNTNLFKILGDIRTNNNLFGLIQWKWDISPNEIVTASWGEDGSCAALVNSNHTSLAIAPGGTPVTLKIGDKTLQGRLNGTGAPVSKFKFADETKAFIYYTGMEDVPKGSKGNPYLVSFADKTETNPENNNYQRDENSNITLTGSTEECYYKLTDNAPSGKNPSLTVGNNAAGTIHIISENNTFTSLEIGSNRTCTIEGTGLKPTHADVTGTLTLNAPLTMVREGIVSNDNVKDASCLYIHDGGKVTVNSTLKATAKSINGTNYGYAIHIGDEGSSGTLTIGSEGKVYGYGANTGCYLKGQNAELKIEGEGILRLAAKNGAFSSPSSEKSPATIRWDFMHAPTEAITVKDNGSTVVNFSTTEFDANFTDATSFATNVKANTDYTLWQNNQQLTGVLNNTATQTFRTENGLATYNQVGIPLIVDQSGQTITLTSEGKYQIGEGSEMDFNNILSGITMKSLVVNEDVNNVILDNVTVSDTMTVTKGNSIFLYLTNTNNISAIVIKGNLTIYGTGSTLSNNATPSGLPVITNEGTFYDYTGKIQSVQIPVSNTDTITLTISINGNNQVEQGVTTALTAVSSLKPTKAADYPNSTTEYQWQKKENNKWNDISSATDKTYNAGIGKYRCFVKEKVTIGSGPSQQTILTGLYTSPFDVTLKSGSTDTPGGGNVTPPTPPIYYTVTLPAVEGATTDPVAGSYQVEAWDSFRFKLTLDPEYDQSQPVVTTSRNGSETLTADTLAGGSLKYRIRSVEEEIVVSIDGIVRNNAPTALDAMPTASAVRVSSYGGLLYIETPAAVTIRLYDFRGRLLRSTTVPAGYSSIQKPSGPCILVAGEQRFKVGE